jgi:hypothetical protein
MLLDLVHGRVVRWSVGLVQPEAALPARRDQVQASAQFR